MSRIEAVPAPLKKDVIIVGAYRAQIAVGRLIARSCWFEVTPLPDDKWRFTVKNESAPVSELTEAALVDVARHAAIRSLAQGQCVSGETEIDENAIVSEAEGSAYVGAWLYVEFLESDINDLDPTLVETAEDDEIIDEGD